MFYTLVLQFHEKMLWYLSEEKTEEKIIVLQQWYLWMEKGKSL